MRVVFFILLMGLLWGGRVQAQGCVITGTVKGGGELLEAVTVVVEGGGLATTTGRKGEFRLGPVRGDSCVLLVSHAGYQSKRMSVPLTGAATRIGVLLEAGITELDQVVVTGVSRATLIRENPLAMRLVSTKEIRQSNASNVIDAIAGNAPGLSVVKTGPNVSKPFINGLGYNRVLTLYDGLRVETQQWGDEHGVPIDDYVIERAEVIKGPASLMYGSDAIAGVVSLFPAVPHVRDGLLKIRLLSEVQSNNGLVGNGLMLSRGAERWSWALRGSERIARSYTNPVDGRVYNTGFRTGNASGFLGYASRKGHSQLSATWYDNRQAIPDGSRDSLTRQFTYQVFESAGENVLLPQVDNIKNRPLVPKGVLNGYGLSALTQRIQDWRLYSDHAYDVGAGELRASLGFEENRRREFNHPTAPKQPGEYLVLRTLSYGARYNAPSFLNIELSAGFNGMYQTNLNDRVATDFPIPDYHLFDLGGFAYGKWKRGRWTLAGGVRYDGRSERGAALFARPDPATGFYQRTETADTVGTVHPFSPFTLHFRGVSGSLGATVQLSEHLYFKANVARGYRAPNITEIASNGLDPGAHIYYIGNLSFSPEFSLQEDAGLNGEWADWSFGVNVFNNYIEHYIYQDQAVDAAGNPLVIIPGNRTFQFLQTDAQLYGGDAELRIHPAAWGGFRLDNVFSCVYGFNRSNRYKNAGNQGKYLPFIPPPHLSSTAEYEHRLMRGPLRSVTVRAQVDHYLQQDRYLGLYKTETPTAAYTLVNVSVQTEVRCSDKHSVRFQLGVNNLFNTAYQSHLSRLQYFEYYTASPNGRLGIYEMGRNICLKAIWEML